ncbi:unnamed protein product [Rotaria socialis]|uniref:Uncharacterized protein n=1 Tax=Rotaria socialis TaxID=392032 RepID=A0A818SRL5_9BILA|nr:unnamed protein product [Rotaria socialis]
MKPVKIERETSGDLQSKVTTALEEECSSNPLWLVEIEVPREFFTCRAFPGALITAQQTIIRHQSEVPDKLSDCQMDSNTS